MTTLKLRFNTEKLSVAIDHISVLLQHADRALAEQVHAELLNASAVDLIVLTTEEDAFLKCKTLVALPGPLLERAFQTLKPGGATASVS